MFSTIFAGLRRRFTDYDNPRCPGRRMRARRVGPLVDMIRRVHEEQGRVRIIDIGGTRSYWRIIPDEILDRYDVHVTVVNLPDMMPDDGDEPRFTHVAGDGCDLSDWPDGAFDIAHSNSVLEHVGDWSRMSRFATESQRVARHSFIQTPHFWFPIEPHCMVPLFHWLPKSWRVSLLMRRRMGNWPQEATVDGAVRRVEGSRLVDHKMFRELFGDAEIRTERFFGLPKSMVAVTQDVTAVEDVAA